MRPGRFCGPSKLCTCDTNGSVDYLTMDCSGTNVPLKEVCKFTLENPNITAVIYNSNNVSVLRHADLLGCENVQELSLRNVSLSHVEADVFSDMKQLTVLDLRLNDIDIYEGDHVAFLSGLSSLRELELCGNLKSFNSTKLSYPIFSNMSKLEILSLDGLHDIPFRSSYQNLQRLTRLKMSGQCGLCFLGELTNATFENLLHLKVLDLSNCSVTNVHAGTFKILRNLTWLDLSLNREIGFIPLRNISYGLQFTKIDFLNLSKVYNTFGPSTTLRRQDVCYLRNTTLRELNLDSNRMRLFETNIALMLPDTFQVLHVRDNTFTFGLYLLQAPCAPNVTAVYAGLQNYPHAPLQYLDDPVQKSSFVSENDDECTFEQSDYLYNRSRHIAGCKFFKTEKISKADLYNAGFPKSLKIMSFHDSGMNYIVEKYPIKPFNNLVESLDLSGNILYSWIGPIGPFPSIKSLNLSRNYCSHLESGIFTYMSSLENLYLQQNFLGIPLASDTNGAIFKYLNNLRVLDLSVNQIRHLPPKVFVHLQKLQMLNLSINIITEWTTEIDTLYELQHVDLKSNALSALPQSVMSHFDEFMSREQKVFTIDMGKNPLKCTCKYEQFLTWMVKHKSFFVGFETYNITDDSGTPLTSEECIIKVNNFTKACRSFTLLIILCTIGITLFISLVTSGLIYKNRWKLRYLLYMNKRRFFGYRAVPDYEPIENFRYDAFISYAEENIRFILDGIIPKLEREHELSLCIHQRDFIAGNAVTENIINAIQSSKKTVVVLSRDFLKSKWCLYEFHMARMESFYSRDGNSILVVVMLENIPPNKLMPLEMIEWIKQESYIEYTDDAEGNILFWENLKQAISQ